MADRLGDGCHIIEEGLSARTTSVNDPNDPRLNGADYLPAALASHLPLDLVIIMLGTNDTKSYFRRMPYEIANGMAKLAGQILTSAGGVGTPYPPHGAGYRAAAAHANAGPWFQGIFAGGHEKSKALAAQYKAMSDFMKVDFLNAGEFITTDGCDGIHFTAQNNADLGKAVAGKVKEIFLRESNKALARP